jgi:hypothetical protein
MRHYKVYIFTGNDEDQDQVNNNVWIHIYCEGKNTLDALEDAEERLNNSLSKSLNDFPSFNIFFKWED